MSHVHTSDCLALGCGDTSHRSKPSDYYRLDCCGKQAVELVQGRPYNVATALVYLLRAGRKPGNPALADIKKAHSHLGFEIARMEKDRP